MKVFCGKKLLCDADLAISIKDRVKGLMGRTLSEKEGMLFIFPHKGMHAIWMMGMKQSIDIVFIDDDKKVVNIARAVSPLGLNPLTWQSYFPHEPVRYILELSPNSLVNKGDGLTWGKL